MSFSICLFKIYFYQCTKLDSKRNRDCSINLVWYTWIPGESMRGHWHGGGRAGVAGQQEESGGQDGETERRGYVWEREGQYSSMWVGVCHLLSNTLRKSKNP